MVIVCPRFVQWFQMYFQAKTNISLHVLNFFSLQNKHRDSFTLNGDDATSPAHPNQKTYFYDINEM